MEFVTDNYSNIFIKPVADGGKGLPDWILERVGDTSVYTNTNIYDDIQDNHTDDDVKALEEDKVKEILTWMVDSGYSSLGKKLVRKNKSVISYVPEDEFGCDNYANVDGTDNGDGTSTVNLASAFKPDGLQCRWGIFWGVNHDYSFSSIVSTNPDFTGVQGESYDLLMSVKFANGWRTKEVRVSFNSI